jgi:uncharacterized membrane protein YhhN
LRQEQKPISKHPQTGTRSGYREVEWLFAALAVAFVASIALLPYPGDFLLKASPIACLVIAVGLAGTGPRQRLVIAALVFSAIGDISLERGVFILGLGAFLVAHLFYLTVFCRRLRPTPTGAVALLALALYALVLMVYLSPRLGESAVPVYLYMGVLFAMAGAAIIGRDNHTLVAIGAVLFVLSDSLIAIDRFAGPVPGARYAIMVLYYAAQYLLTHDARQPPGYTR